MQWQYSVVAKTLKSLDYTFDRYLQVQAPIIVQKVDSTIRWINLYPVDSAIIIGFPNTYPLESDLSGG